MENQSIPTKASEQPSQSQQPVRQSSNGGGKTGTIIASLIGIAVLVLIVSALVKKDSPVDNGNQNVGVVNGNRLQNTNINQPEPDFSEVNLDVSTWKTYKNDEFGFEVKYPTEIAIAENTSEDSNFVINFDMPAKIARNCICRMSISLMDNVNNVTITEWMKQKGFMTLEEYEKELATGMPGVLEQKEVTVGGVTGIEYDRGMEGGGSHTILLPLNRKILELSGWSETYAFNNTNKNNQMRKMFDMMSSTLVIGTKLR